MLNGIKSLFTRAKNKVKLIVGTASACMCAAVMSIAACAEETSTASDLGSIITNAGETLKNEFITLVSTLIPVVIGIAVVGLSIYAVVTLFSMAKKFFKKAAG